jgi:hypothetical protein
VVHRVLVLLAFWCCAISVASFGLFARDQLAGASEHQQQEIVAGATTTPGVAPIAKHHTQPRRFIDGAAKLLAAPFESIVQSSNQWAHRGSELFFALLAYGIGLGYLARYSRGLP